MKKVRLGLIGAGWVARQHLEVINDIKWIEAVGITSRTMLRARQVAEDYKIPSCFDDTKLLVEGVKPDALMVLVSEDQIFDVTKDAMKYRLPLFIEKPAGLSPEENRKLTELSRKYSVRTMVGFNRRYYSIFHKGIDIIREHGPLMGLAVEGHERIWRVHKAKKFSNRVVAQWIFANSTHTIDLLRFFAGETNKVMSLSRRYTERHGDQFAAVVEFSSGTIGQYQAYWHSPDGWSVSLYGDGVTVKFKPLEKGCWIDRDFKTHEIKADVKDVKYKPGFYRQMEAFGRYVRSGQTCWPMLDLEGSYKTMLLAEDISSNLDGKVHLTK